MLIVSIIELFYCTGRVHCMHYRPLIMGDNRFWSRGYHELDEEACFQNIEQYNKHTISFRNSRLKKKYFPYWKKNKKTRILKLSLCFEIAFWIANILGIGFVIICALLGIPDSLMWMLAVWSMFMVSLRVGAYFYIWRYDYDQDKFPRDEKDRLQEKIAVTVVIIIGLLIFLWIILF